MSPARSFAHFALALLGGPVVQFIAAVALIQYEDTFDPADGHPMWSLASLGPWTFVVVLWHAFWWWPCLALGLFLAHLWLRRGAAVDASSPRT